MWKKISIAAAGTVVGGLILAVIPKTSGLVIKVVSWVWNAVSWGWGLLYSSHPVPGGVILVLSLLALFGLVIIGLLLKESLRGKEGLGKPAFLDYTDDLVDGLRWRWRWRVNQIDGLWCFFPICDAELVHSENYGETDFICERCPSDGTLNPFGDRGRVVATVRGGNRYYAMSAAEREIRRRIRTRER